MAVPNTADERKANGSNGLGKKDGEKKKIPQHILSAFCHFIQCNMEGEGNQVKETYDTHLRTAIWAQQKIGFAMMMQGFLAKDWMEALIQQGVPSLEQKMNTLHEILWIEIIEHLWRVAATKLHKTY